jgi:uncharacterized membrane protein (Fun14 family)
MVEILTPLLTQLGVGGLAGLCSGYAMKKMGKVIAFIIGIVFLFLQLLAYQGFITINYQPLIEWANGITSQIGLAESALIVIIANLPFGGGFLAGFVIGLKVG